MSIYYAKSTHGFYDTAIHGDNIPADAVGITADEHAALLLSQIATLESTISERRKREAILGTDNGWLAGIEAQIAALRAQLE